MKAAAFDLAYPADLAHATALLARPDSRALAGGQSLGPMLNLRVAAPAMLVSVSHLPELSATEDGRDAITIGACVTHAAIADGRTPDLGGGWLARVADRIAYRAVRNRGTIGGSLCHADPAADWPCVLSAFGAEAVMEGARGATRRLPLADFLLGAFRVAVAPGELLTAVRIPRPSPDARFGYHKLCRKPGEFAHAMAAVLHDPSRGVLRIAIGAAGGAPIVAADPRAALAALEEPDPVSAHMQAVALRRALAEAGVGA